MCVDHVGAGEFTAHFSAIKVNAPLMPEGGGGGGGGPGVSNDWCIIVPTFRRSHCEKKCAYIFLVSELLHVANAK